MRKAIRIVTAAAAVLLFQVAPAGASTAPGCSTVPVGTANNPPADPEPTSPIWCSTLTVSPQATGVADGFGGWIDPFSNTISGTSPAHLNDGEAGYHAYEGISNGDGTSKSQHFEANGYFMADMTKGALDSGTDLSPARSFTFQNGKLVLEGDVAADELGFADSSGGDIVWPEIVWSTTPAPSAATVTDNLYLYGYFAGGWAGGCRLQIQHMTCALEADHTLSSVTNDQAPCYSVSPSRVMELSGFQQCGTVHSGFAVDFGSDANAWRLCPAGTVDPCLDRFRLEWSQAGFVAYINGVKVAEDSGWPGYAQIPAAIVNGSTPIYAHFGEFGDFSDSNVYRFHWGRIAVNPHNPDGTPMAPSASPTFGPKPTPPPGPSPTPSPSPTPMPAPTPESITAVPCTVTLGGQQRTGVCSGTFTPS